MVPWLKEITHVAAPSFRRITKIIPSIEAKLSPFLPVEPAISSDDSSDDAESQAMDISAGATPTKRPSVVQPTSEAALILQEPGVSRIVLSIFLLF
jgi:hypothetical protein